MTLPCPFCGGRAELRGVRGVPPTPGLRDVPGCQWKECVDCGARGPTTGLGPDAACEVWNTRSDANGKAALRIDQLRRDLAGLFHLCQWGKAVAGTALTFNGEVEASYQALVNFLHEPLFPNKEKP